MDNLQMSLGVIITLVIVALLFDFMNGFHDAANSIATIVSTRVLKPHQAVIWAAAFNFLAYFLFELKVAGTIGKGTIWHVIIGKLPNKFLPGKIGNRLLIQKHILQVIRSHMKFHNFIFLIKWKIMRGLLKD